MNERIKYLILFIFWVLTLVFIHFRLRGIEKMRCDVWRWEVCGELMK